MVAPHHPGFPISPLWCRTSALTGGNTPGRKGATSVPTVMLATARQCDEAPAESHKHKSMDP